MIQQDHLDPGESKFPMTPCLDTYIDCMFAGSHISGMFLDRLDEVVVLVLFINHHCNQAILRHKLRTANTQPHISMRAMLFYFTKT